VKTAEVSFYISLQPQDEDYSFS